jgi:hypothetical protein
MPIAHPRVRALDRQIRRACELLRLPGQDARAQERAVVDALFIMDFQMDRFAYDRKLEARAAKTEQKWLANLQKAHAARPAWLDAPELDKQVQAQVQAVKRAPPSGIKRRQATAYRKGLAASMAYGLMHKFGFKLTGHRHGKFCRLSGVLYNGDPRANCYSYCCEMLQQKKALRKKKAAR